jgi:phage FluMu protein gp41
MRKVEVTLDKGITIGPVTHKTAVLKEPSALDVIRAMKASEELVMVPTLDSAGHKVSMEPQFIASATQTGVNILLSQLVSIGTEFQAPIEENILDLLSPTDLNILQQEANKLEHAASREVAQMGRHDTQSEAAEDSDQPL